jgi:hypothetical protein
VYEHCFDLLGSKSLNVIDYFNDRVVDARLIEIDFQEVGWEDAVWINPAHDTVQCALLNLRYAYRAGNFLSNRSTLSFTGMVLFHGVGIIGWLP